MDAINKVAKKRGVRLTGFRRAAGGRRARGSSGALAHYKRIKLEITRMLSSGEVKADTPFPTEKQLAARFRVSVGTVRRAMDDLVAEHIVIRQQGRGTFPALFSAERLLNRFWPVFRKDGTREIPIVQTLLFQRERADTETAEALLLRKGESVYRIVNLLLMSGNPVMLDDVQIPQALFPRLTEQNFVARETTMYGFYQSRYGVGVIRTLDRVTSVGADATTARRLAVPVGQPLLAYTRVAYTFGDKPVELRRTLIHTAAHEYRNAIGGENALQGKRPLVRGKSVVIGSQQRYR